MDIEFEPVIERLKQALKLKSDAEVASALGMSPSSFGERKGRGTLPFDRLLPLAYQRNVDVDWLLAGKVNQAVGESPGRYDKGVDVQLLATVIAGARTALRDRGVELSPAKEAKVIAWLYEHFKAKGQADEAAYTRFLDLILES